MTAARTAFSPPPPPPDEQPDPVLERISALSGESVHNRLRVLHRRIARTGVAGLLLPVVALVGAVAWWKLRVATAGAQALALDQLAWALAWAAGAAGAAAAGATVLALPPRRTNDDPRLRTAASPVTGVLTASVALFALLVAMARPGQLRALIESPAAILWLVVALAVLVAVVVAARGVSAARALRKAEVAAGAVWPDCWLPAAAPEEAERRRLAVARMAESVLARAGEREVAATSNRIASWLLVVAAIGLLAAITAAGTWTSQSRPVLWWSVAGLEMALELLVVALALPVALGRARGRTVVAAAGALAAALPAHATRTVVLAPFDMSWLVSVVLATHAGLTLLGLLHAWRLHARVRQRVRLPAMPVLVDALAVSDPTAQRHVHQLLQRETGQTHDSDPSEWQRWLAGIVATGNRLPRPAEATGGCA